MDTAYWRERCAAAEAALAKARTGLLITELRRKALEALGDLHADEWLATPQACELLQLGLDQGYSLLRTMEKMGLVERMPGRRGTDGEPSRWRLGYLVQVPTETEQAEPAT